LRSTDIFTLADAVNNEQGKISPNQCMQSTEAAATSALRHCRRAL